MENGDWWWNGAEDEDRWVYDDQTLESLNPFVDHTRPTVYLQRRLLRKHVAQLPVR